MAQVSAYVTAAHIKFLLLHDGRSEDAIRGFFREIYDSYLRVHPFCMDRHPRTTLLHHSHAS